MTDRAAEINAMFADPTRDVVELAAETYPVSSAVISNGKALVGRHREASRIAANPDFNRLVAGNSVIVTAQGAHGAAMRDFSVDVASVGNTGDNNDRICGIIVDRCLRFNLERLS